MSLRLAIDNGTKHINNMSTCELAESMNIAANLPFNQRTLFYEKLISPDVPALQGEVTAPYWLMSSFEENVWMCRFSNTHTKVINFNVSLDDGRLLTDDQPMHRKLLFTIKYWLCSQSHPRYCGGNQQSQVISCAKVLRCLNIIDAMLLNAKHFKLSRYGLKHVTSNDAIALLSGLQLGVPEGVYELSSRVTAFLKNNIKDVSGAEIARAAEIYPDLAKLPKERFLNLTDVELIHARVWLLNHNAHEYPKKPGITGDCRTSFFLREIYGDTLTGQAMNAPNFKELRVTNQTEHETEYRAVPVNNQGDVGMGIDALRRFIATFKSLTIVSGPGFAGVNPDIMHDINIRSVEIDVSHQNPGRYRSLPAQLAFDAMKCSFEFAFEYVDDIFQAVSDMVIWASAQPKASRGNVVLRNATVACCVSKKLSALGVQRWRITNDGIWEGEHKGYFNLLRSNMGLYELYEVLMGSIQTVIGILMARRVGAMIDLSGNCLQPNIDPYLAENENVGYFLIFDNRKSGDGEEREILSRPILRAGAKLIWKMRAFRQKLIDAKCLMPNAGLLLAINQISLKATTIDVDNYNNHFDTFCDYTETPVINIGSENAMRYYLRQHQLRRFFAMTFFWSSGFDGLDTLRYFLGHTDAEHLYHYITESVPGTMLRGVKADKLVSSIERNEIVNIESLRELLKQRFGVDTISIKSVEATMDELSEEVEAGLLQTDPPLSTLRQQLDAGIHLLMEDGTIDLQPEFFTVINAAGEPVQDFRLVLIVRGGL